MIFHNLVLATSIDVYLCRLNLVCQLEKKGQKKPCWETLILSKNTLLTPDFAALMSLIEMKLMREIAFVRMRPS